jgi:Leucine-rich repeat (LRR) protein
LGRSGVESLPESVGELSNLQQLDLDSCPVRALPGSFSELRRLQKLDLRHCSDELRQSFESLQDLMPDSCEVTWKI